MANPARKWIPINSQSGFMMMYNIPLFFPWIPNNSSCMSYHVVENVSDQDLQLLETGNRCQAAPASWVSWPRIVGPNHLSSGDPQLFGNGENGDLRYLHDLR